MPIHHKNITVPDKFQFKTEIKVSINDINYGNHVGNDKIVAFLNESRMQLLKTLGYQNEIRIENVGLILADLSISFKSEAFYGDEIRIELSISKFERVSFDIIYLLTNLTKKKIIAIAKTKMIFFDYTTKKVKSVPEAFKEKFLS